MTFDDDACERPRCVLIRLTRIFAHECLPRQTRETITRAIGNVRHGTPVSSKKNGKCRHGRPLRDHKIDKKNVRHARRSTTLTIHACLHAEHYSCTCMQCGSRLHACGRSAPVPCEEESAMAQPRRTEQHDRPKSKQRQKTKKSRSSGDSSDGDAAMLHS